MFDHVPEQRERWLRVSGRINTIKNLEMTVFRITCRDCPHRSCLYIWESTLEVLICDKYGTVAVDTRHEIDRSVAAVRINAHVFANLTRQLLDLISYTASVSLSLTL